MERSRGQMAVSMKATMSTTKKKEWEPFIGLTAENTRAAGKTANSTDKEIILQPAERSSKASGRRENDFSGCKAPNKWKDENKLL